MGRGFESLRRYHFPTSFIQAPEGRFLGGFFNYLK